MISTPEDIHRFRLVTIRAGLRLELLGMRHSSNSIFKAAKQVTGEKTRAKCLVALDALLEK
jgi:hypothetical protein